MSLVGGVVTRLGREVTGIIGMWKSYRCFRIGVVMADVLGVKKKVVIFGLAHHKDP